MANINQITHTNPLTQQKVNFFADYFDFVVDNIGLYDELEIENYLSLIEKAIFQIQYNILHCPKYLDSYFSHPLLHKNNKYFKEFKNYNSILKAIRAYNQVGSHDKKSNWITENPEFTKSLEKFRNELKRNMVKKAIDSIISFLLCDHSIEKHILDLKYYTNTVVSEFILNKRCRNDIHKTLERIFSKEISKAPFPSNIKKKYPGMKLKEAKTKFIESRSFKQQFQGIHNVLREPLKNVYFLYRVIGINAESGFSYRYNKVTFYHSEHPKFSEIIKKTQARSNLKNFFSRSPMLIAVIKLSYHSLEIAKDEAVDLIQSELDHMNYKCDSNAYIEKLSYLLTKNFKDFRWHKNFRDEGHNIGAADKIHLNDNPYKFLSTGELSCRNNFLEYEPLFLKAMTSHNMPDYWHYLEAIIPTKSDAGKKQIIDTVSSILLLTSENINKKQLRNYIENGIAFGTSLELLGIDRQKYIEIYGKISNMKMDYGELAKEIKHDFLSYLIKQKRKKFTPQKLKEMKAYYSRVLWEHQAQRNSMVHTGQGNQNAMIMLGNSLPMLIVRLRWILFEKIKTTNENSLQKLIESLKDKGDNLLVDNP